MASRDTVLIVAVLGLLSAVFVLFMVGITRALDPNPDREENLRRLAVIELEEDVKPQYNSDDTAIVTLIAGQKSGPVIFKEITWFGEVKIDLLRTLPITGGPSLVQSVMRPGDTAYSCEYREIRLLNNTADTATFRFVAGGFCGGYCWHMYQPEIYDDYIGALSAS